MPTALRLPRPVTESWDWQRYGACRGRGTTQFFHPDGERGASRARREESAKRVCRSCPVRPECAAHALTVREPYGVWGGFSEHERLKLLASGRDDLVDRRHGRADIGRLEACLSAADAGPVSAPPPAPSANRSHRPVPAVAAAGAGCGRSSR